MKSTRPPKVAEKILSILSSSKKTGLLGDTEEEYRMIHSESGRLRANIWYARQIFLPLPFLFKSTLFWSFGMLKNYLISLSRTLKRQKIYSFINITGLAIGLACCILISQWINFEISYDRFHKNSHDLYQVTNEILLPNGDRRSFTNTPGALAGALKSDRPEIRDVSRMADDVELMLGTPNKRFLENIRFVDPAFLEMFSFEFIEGNPKTALSQPDSIVLTENTAQKHFSKEEALGRKVLLGSSGNLQVTGVIKEMPENSFLSSQCLVPMTFLGIWDGTSTIGEAAILILMSI